MGGFFMLIKIIIWISCYVLGRITIYFLPKVDLQNLPFFISELIMNPLRFFLGMITLIMTVLLLSVYIKSIIEETYSLLMRKNFPSFLLIYDYSIFFCYLLLSKESVAITALLLVLSVSYGIISVDLKRKDIYGADY